MDDASAPASRSLSAAKISAFGVIRANTARMWSERWRSIVTTAALITLVATIAALVEAEAFLIVNYVYAGLIGLGTGATELMSRYRDRPFDAVISAPGLGYMMVNAAAAVLAFYFLTLWQKPEGDSAVRVLTAGIGAMAVFRSGLFTTRVGGQDIPIGPNFILKTILDVLDRAYDRQRANRRAELIGTIMGGVDFAQAKASLTELSLNLMQNVAGEEREKIAREIERVGGLGGLGGEAQAMVLGLKLIDIVGENTLRAAATNLGSSISSFVPLSVEIVNAMAKPKKDDILSSLLSLCNGLSHARARLTESDLRKLQESIASTASLNASAKATLIVYSARQQFGEKALIAGLALLPVDDTSPPPAPAPSLPPAQPIV